MTTRQQTGCSTVSQPGRKTVKFVTVERLPPLTIKHNEIKEVLVTKCVLYVDKK